MIKSHSILPFEGVAFYLDPYDHNLVHKHDSVPMFFHFHHLVDVSTLCFLSLAEGREVEDFDHLTVYEVVDVGCDIGGYDDTQREPR